MKVSKSAILQFFVFHIFLLVYWLTFPYKDRWSSTFVLLALVLVLILLEYLRSYLFISPALLWYAFWLGVISVARMDLQLYPFYRTWETPLLKTVLLNTGVFYWCYWIGEACTANRSSQIIKLRRKELFGNVMIAAFLLSCIAFILNVLATGVIPQLTGDANSYREMFVQTKYYKIITILRFCFVLLPVAVKNVRTVRKKILLVFFAALLVFLEMLSGWRTYTLQTMILLLTGLFISSDSRNRVLRRRNIGIAAIFAVVAVVFIGYVAVTRDKVYGAFAEKLEYLKYTIYMYIAPNFLNFQSAMETVVPKNAPVYATTALWTYVFDLYTVMLKIGSIDQSIGTFNVSTYMLQPWGDYGTAGTVLCSGMIAFVSGWSFGKSRRHPSIFQFVLLGLMNTTVFLLHNNLFPRGKAVVLWLLLAFLLNCIFCGKGETETDA